MEKGKGRGMWKKREGKKRKMNEETYQRNEEQRDHREGAESRQRELGSHSLLPSFMTTKGITLKAAYRFSCQACTLRQRTISLPRQWSRKLRLLKWTWLTEHCVSHCAIHLRATRKFLYRFTYCLSLDLLFLLALVSDIGF